MTVNWRHAISSSIMMFPKDVLKTDAIGTYLYLYNQFQPKLVIFKNGNVFLISWHFCIFTILHFCY